MLYKLAYGNRFAYRFLSILMKYVAPLAIVGVG